MKGYDAFAGVIKSGGKTRRAAKMVILDADHPDVLDFIDSKMLEEKKAWALIEQGYDPSFTGEAYGSVFFQNANHSVRVTDEFMHAVEADGQWTTKSVLDGQPVDTLSARDIFRRMADAAWICGDPGIQYDTTINDWHTSANTDRIYASNPCSEYMFLNDTACNLASLNLMKFVREDGEFDVEDYRYAARVTLTAQEILVDNASYPTPRIEENSHKFRPLGLGYANLGALLMSRGLAYDSDEGRAFAASLTAIMHGEAYRQSSVIARDHGGPFLKYDENRAPFLRVIGKHRDAAYQLKTEAVPQDILDAAKLVYDEALELGKEYGYRNAQVTVLAPTGTIAFMMDCDTTGIEPDIALIKYKKLVGEGFLKIVNQTVPVGLRKLGYTADEVAEILDYVNEQETIEGAPGLKPEHLPVFDCAFKPVNGTRSIHYMGHIRMMGAVQPFISGAISKTVNMPEAATAEEIEQVYLEGWKQGLKAIAIYRDNSKRSQPLSTGKKKDEGSAEQQALIKQLQDQLVASQVEAGKPHRRRLPAERTAVTHKFDIAGHEGYITVGLYPDGQPGEIFLKMAKEGSDRLGPDGRVRHDRVRLAPVRRPAPRPGEQVRARPVRAFRLHRQQRDPDRQVPGRLHLPVDGLAVPVRRGQGRSRADRPNCHRRLRRSRWPPARLRSLRLRPPARPPASPPIRSLIRPVRPSSPRPRRTIRPISRRPARSSPIGKLLRQRG